MRGCPRLSTGLGPGMEGLLSRGLPCDFPAMYLLSEDESHGTTDDLGLLDGGSDWYSRVLPHDADSSGSCLGLEARVDSKSAHRSSRGFSLRGSRSSVVRCDSSPFSLGRRRPNKLSA